MKAILLGSLALIVIVSGCLGQAQSVIERPDCKTVAERFLEESPDVFESIEDGRAWCQQCTYQSGGKAFLYGDEAVCLKRTTDAGVVCLDSSSCEGLCMTENENDLSGHCSATTKVFGCFYEFMGGEKLRVCNE